jgi:hypothetical protein
MSVLVKQVEDKLCELVRDAAKKAMAAGELPEAELTDFKVEIPADERTATTPQTPQWRGRELSDARPL